MLKNEAIQQLVSAAEDNCRKNVEQWKKSCGRFPGMWETEKESILRNLFFDSLRKLEDQIDKLIKESSENAPVSWNDRDWELIENRLADACELRKEIRLYHPADLGFDQIRSNFCIWSNALGNLEVLSEDPEPVGKAFALTLKLKNGNSFAAVPYTFTVNQKYDGKIIGPHWEGYTHFEGFGRFPGYCGGCGINIKRTDGEWTSVLFQKVYTNTEDPAWNRKKEELADWVVYVLKDDPE